VSCGAGRRRRTFDPARYRGHVANHDVVTPLAAPQASRLNVVAPRQRAREFKLNVVTAGVLAQSLPVASTVRTGAMESVGLREAKARLSALARAAANGELVPLSSSISKTRTSNPGPEFVPNGLLTNNVNKV
jgi:hypothetical protein